MIEFTINFEFISFGNSWNFEIVKQWNSYHVTQDISSNSIKYIHRWTYNVDHTVVRNMFFLFKLLIVGLSADFITSVYCAINASSTISYGNSFC